MLILSSTSDLVTVETSTAASLEVHASWMDNASGTITPGRTNTAAWATTTETTVVAAAASGSQRNVKYLNIFNDHASATASINVQHTDGTNKHSIFKGTLLAGEKAQYDQEGDWLIYTSAGLIKTSTAALVVNKYVTADISQATTAFADITGLTASLKSGVNYNFEALILNVNSTPTTASRYGVNGPASPTVALFNVWQQITNSSSAAAFGGGSSTAYDTSIAAPTAGATAIKADRIHGYIIPSADGTLAIRSASSVATSSGILIKRGSWLRVWQTDN